MFAIEGHQEGLHEQSPEQELLSLENFGINLFDPAMNLDERPVETLPEYYKVSILCIKDHSNYLLGETRTRSNTVRKDSFKIFKGGKELYYHEFEQNLHFYGVVFIDFFNSYFLLVNGFLLRKNINRRPPRPYMRLADPGSTPENLFKPKHFRDASYGRVVLHSGKRFRMINLITKKFGLSFRFDHSICDLSICSRDGGRLAVLTKYSYLSQNFYHLRDPQNTTFLTLHYVALRGAREIDQKAIPLATTNSFENYKAVSSSVDNKFCCVLIHRSTRFYESNLFVFEMRRNKVVQRNCFTVSITTLRPLFSDLTFYAQSRAKYLLLLFFRQEYRDVVPVVYDANKNSLKVLEDKMFRSGEAYPFRVQWSGEEQFVLVSKLKPSQIS